MAVRRDRPVWLVIAVTKADLFADDAPKYTIQRQPFHAGGSERPVAN